MADLGLIPAVGGGFRGDEEAIWMVLIRWVLGDVGEADFWPFGPWAWAANREATRWFWAAI